MIKRCGRCGRVASSALTILIDGKDESVPLLCNHCKNMVLRDIRKVLAEAESKEVTIVKSYSYEKRD